MVELADFCFGLPWATVSFQQRHLLARSVGCMYVFYCEFLQSICWRKCCLNF